MKIKELLSNFQYFLNAEQDKKHTNISKSKSAAIYFADYQSSLLELESIFKNINPEIEATKESLAPLKDFLAQRWELIRGTKLAYTINTQSPITNLCFVLADALKPVYEISAYKLMMPTLEVEYNDVTATNLGEAGLQLQQIVLSDDDKYFIEVQPAIAYSEDGFLKYQNSVEGVQEPNLPKGIKKLSHKEKDRIINHSAEAKDYYESVQKLYEIKHKGLSIGAHIQRFVNRLHDGGMHGKAEGEDFKAGHDANEAIVEFVEFYKTLTPEEQEDLKKRKADDTSKDMSFGYLYERLTDPANISKKTKDEAKKIKAENFNSNYCVDLISGVMGHLLEKNPDLFEKYPKNANQSKAVSLQIYQQQTNELRAKLTKELASESYKVQSDYGKAGQDKLMHVTCPTLAEKIVKGVIAVLSDDKQADANKILYLKRIIPNAQKLISIKELKAMLEKAPAKMVKPLFDSIGQLQLQEIINGSYALNELLTKLSKDNIHHLLSLLGRKHLAKIFGNNKGLEICVGPLPKEIGLQLTQFMQLGIAEEIIANLTTFNKEYSPQLLREIFVGQKASDFITFDGFIAMLPVVPVERIKILFECFGHKYFRAHINSVENIAMVLCSTPDYTHKQFFEMLGGKFLSDLTKNKDVMLKEMLPKDCADNLFKFIEANKLKNKPILGFFGNLKRKSESKEEDELDPHKVASQLTKVLGTKCRLRSLSFMHHQLTFVPAQNVRAVKQHLQTLQSAKIAVRMSQNERGGIFNRHSDFELMEPLHVVARKLSLREQLHQMQNLRAQLDQMLGLDNDQFNGMLVARMNRA